METVTDRIKGESSLKRDGEEGTEWGMKQRRRKDSVLERAMATVGIKGSKLIGRQRWIMMGERKGDCSIIVLCAGARAEACHKNRWSSLVKAADMALCRYHPSQQNCQWSFPFLCSEPSPVYFQTPD